MGNAKNSLQDEIALPLALSENSRKAYAKDVSRFKNWGGEIPCNQDIIVLYLNDHANTHKPSTLERWSAAIAAAHEAIAYPNPCQSKVISDTIAVIRNKRGKKGLPTKPRRVNPAVLEELVAMISHLPDSIAGVRDRAILLVGFCGALRRSEIAALTIEKIKFSARGMEIDLGISKTDQTGEDDPIAILYAKGDICPVDSLKAWIRQANIEAGPIFRPITKSGTIGKSHLSGFSIANIIKRAAERAGLSPELYSGHSLRAGLVTTAFAQGKPRTKIKAQTRHRSDSSLEIYNRDNESFNDNAADVL